MVVVCGGGLFNNNKYQSNPNPKYGLLSMIGLSVPMLATFCVAS